jgi:hypothetical protein
MTKHTLLAGSGSAMRVCGYRAAQESNLPSVGLRRRTGVLKIVRKMEPFTRSSSSNRSGRARAPTLRRRRPPRRARPASRARSPCSSRAGRRASPARASEEARARDEGERDEQQPGVAPSPRGDMDGIAEDDRRQRRREHEPEVCGVALPALVRPRLREQDGEEDGREAGSEEPRQHPGQGHGAALLSGLAPRGRPRARWLLWARDVPGHASLNLRRPRALGAFPTLPSQYAPRP